MSISKFESMLKTNSVYFFDAVEFEEIIQYYLSISKLSLAKKAIVLGLEQHPGSVVVKLLKVELSVIEDDIDDALRLLAEIEALEPNNDEVFIQKATISSKRGNHKEAITFLNKSLEFSDEPYDVWAMLGMEYLYLEDFENAKLNFINCLDVDLDDYSSLYNVVYCYEMQEEYEEAITYLKLLLDKNPYSEVGWHQLGRQYFELKNYEKALEAFDYAVLIDESFIGGYLEKAKSLEKLERYEDAIANYLITLKLDDPTAFVYIRVGECYEKLNILGTAIEYYKKAVHEDPLLERAWVLLADVHYEEEQYEKAIYYINKAIEIDDLNTVFWRKCADINLKLNFYEEAVKAFRKCLELGDDVIAIYISIVDVLFFMGEFDEALNILVKAKNTYKDYAEIEFRLCVMFFVLNKKEYSFLHLRNGLALDSEYYNEIKNLFPSVFETEEIKKIITDFKNVLK